MTCCHPRGKLLLWDSRCSQRRNSLCAVLGYHRTAKSLLCLLQAQAVCACRTSTCCSCWATLPAALCESTRAGHCGGPQKSQQPGCAGRSLASSTLMRKPVLLAVVLLCAAASAAARTLLQADPSVYPGASPADQATQEEARLRKLLALLMCCTKELLWPLELEYCVLWHMHWHHCTRGALRSAFQSKRPWT